jgi:hypothetical protein
MAKLTEETTATINSLKQQLLNTVDDATAAEFALFERFGGTERTIHYLNELKSVAERSTSWFSRLSSLEIRIASSQPTVPSDMLELLIQSFTRIQAEVPALERSVQEVKIEWNLL